VCRAAASAPAEAPAAVDAAAFETFLLDTQKQILAEAEQLDGSGQKFVTDRWERPNNTGAQHWKLTACWLWDARVAGNREVHRSSR
jgi:coproporphyrinogen III oxidase